MHTHTHTHTDTHIPFLKTHRPAFITLPSTWLCKGRKASSLLSIHILSSLGLRYCENTSALPARGACTPWFLFTRKREYLRVSIQYSVSLLCIFSLSLNQISFIIPSFKWVSISEKLNFLLRSWSFCDFSIFHENIRIILLNRIQKILLTFLLEL